MTASSYFMILPVLMAFAASYDALALRITNGLCLLLVSSFFPAALIAGLSAYGIVLHVLCGLLALIFGIVMFARGWLGGGDAKLFAAGALWLGWNGLFDFAAVTAVAGGLLALGLLVMRWLSGRFFCNQAVDRLRTVEMPYGIAIAVGVLMVYPHSIWATGVMS